jgi:hypothetical protein
MAVLPWGKVDVGTNELPPKEATQMSREVSSGSRESIQALIRHRVLAAFSTESRSQSYAPSDNPTKP